MGLWGGGQGGLQAPVYCVYLNSTVGHVGDALVRPDHQLDGDRPAGAERAAIPLLVEPVHGLEDLEELEHALKVAEHCVLPEVLLDELAQGLRLVRVDHTLREELVQPNLQTTNIRNRIYSRNTMSRN